MDMSMLITGAKQENAIRLIFNYGEAKKLLAAIKLATMTKAGDIDIIKRVQEDLEEFINLTDSTSREGIHGE